MFDGRRYEDGTEEEKRKEANGDNIYVVQGVNHMLSNDARPTTVALKNA